MSRFLICLALLSLPGSAVAQRVEPWQLSAGVGLVSFSHAASSSGEDGKSFGRASPATTIGAWTTRRIRGWELRAGVDRLRSNLQVLNESVAVAALGTGLTRLRLELLAARTVAGLGNAELVAGAGAALDLWSPPEEGIRTRGAAVARLALRLDAGRFTVENSLSGSLSPSLFEPHDLPEGYRQNAFRTVSAGFEVRFGL